MRELTIDGRRIADDEPCFVVAEIGHNHGGSLDTATRLITASAEAGASAVKFQKRHNETLYTSDVLRKSYENELSYGRTYGEHRQALEFSFDQFVALRAHAGRERVLWFATAFDERSVDSLVTLGVPALKVHSGGLTDEPLLRCVAQVGVPVIVSTGAGTIDDIDRAHALLQGVPHAFLHCTASYPLRPEQANLRAICALRRRYPDTLIGFSSHSPGIAFSLIAYAFGARIIEHHVTLSRASKGTDHGFSLEMKALSTLVEDLEKCRQALGTGDKIVYPSELGPIAKMRRRQTSEGWRIGG